MNREIKFRVWINNSLKYLPHKNFSLIFGDEVPKVLQFHRGTIIGEKINMPIMQYTGLKDKNGKEIYEGDIVRTRTAHSDNGEYIDLREVGYDPERMGFNLESGLMGYDLDNYDLEVVGNIYENPELLENK